MCRAFVMSCHLWTPGCVRRNFLAASRSMTDGLPSRPMLNRGLRRLWRDHATLQLGIEPRHAVVLRGMGRAEECVLDLIDGSRDVEAVVADAAARGVDELAVRRLLAMLLRAAVLDDGALQPRGNERDRQRRRPGGVGEAVRHPTPP